MLSIPTAPNMSFSQFVVLTPRLILITFGIIISAISIQLFMIPFDVAPSGVTGLAVILNSVLPIPVGLAVLLINIPILMLGYRFLGGWTVVFLTMYATVGFSIALDMVTPYLPVGGLSSNVLLNAIFGGVTGGISTALVLRAGGTFGGTSTIAAILQRKMGTPLSSTYLYTDLGIILLAGLVFGWESSLYAMVALYVSGAATDYVLEGPSIIRTVTIITNAPQEVSTVILTGLQRGVTGWQAIGMYSGSERSILYVTISRTEVRQLHDLVRSVDENAFIVVGQGHRAYGSGFRSRNERRKLKAEANPGDTSQLHDT